MRIDLHTHSDRSDGTDTPAELVRRARHARVEVLAITDHDTTEGWAEAAETAEQVGVTLIRGIEISTKYAGHGVHLLAYLPDPTHPGLVRELDRVLEGRNDRLPATLDRLRALGIDIEADDVRRLAGDAAALGRPHVADALVAHGVVRDRDQAFAKYLGPQGPAYVDRYAADLVTMLGTVAAAGGVSVVAHPWASRYQHTALDEAGLAALQQHGLAGIEVDHEDHDEEVREALHGIARNLGLVATGSSDYHGLGKTGHALACNTTAPDQLDLLLELATEAADRSRRATPEVVAG